MSDIKTLKKKKYVRIYNHGSSKVCITLEKKQAVVEAKKHEKPGHVDITWDDLEFLNDRTDVFRNGTLRFAKENEAALYNELAIDNYKDILFHEVLEDIILHPTLTGLQRIIDDKTIGLIERANPWHTHEGS